MNFPRICLFAGLFAAILLASAPAKSQDNRSQGYYSPDISINWSRQRLDWCRELGVNCGKPAADAFCHLRGYGRATKFEKAEHVRPTFTLSDHERCDNPDCAGFKMIQCVGTATVFESPWITNNGLTDSRLDWCLELGVNCGKPAADAYCKKERGFPLGARSFEKAPGVGRTVTINGRANCLNPGCAGFKVIECEPDPPTQDSSSEKGASPLLNRAIQFAGAWKADFGGSFLTMLFQQTGDRVTGRLNANSADLGVIRDGKVVDNTLLFTVMRRAPNAPNLPDVIAGYGELVMDEAGKSFKGTVLGVAVSGTLITR